MKKAFIRALIGGDGTDYRKEGLAAWLTEALMSAVGFFTPIAVGCVLLTIAHELGLI